MDMGKLYTHLLVDGLECPQSWPVVLSILATCHLPGLPILRSAPASLNAGALFCSDRHPFLGVDRAILVKSDEP